MWWDEFPVLALGSQEILDSRHLGWTLQHVVHLPELVGRPLEVGTVVRVDDSRLSSPSDETSECSKEYLGGEAGDHFYVICFGHETYKDSDVALLCSFAASGFLSDDDRTCIINTCSMKCFCWLNSSLR
jgi:hypothetical protein